MALFPSFNLEIENYMDNNWSINSWSKLGDYITRWKGVRRALPGETGLLDYGGQHSYHIIQINQLHVKFNVCACDKP